MTMQFGLLYKNVKGAWASMDDVTHHSISAAVEEAHGLRGYKDTIVLGVFSLDMETGEISQVYNKAQLDREVHAFQYSQMSDSQIAAEAKASRADDMWKDRA